MLARVRARTMTLREATPLLGVSYRHAKRLAGRYRAEGPKGLVHGNVGKRSNRAGPEAERSAVLTLIRAHYSGTVRRGPRQRFGPTLVAEHLWGDHGVLVPVATLTRWMRAAGLWSRVRKAVRCVHAGAKRTSASSYNSMAAFTTGSRSGARAPV